MSETTNLKLFKHDNPSTNTNQFDVEKSLNQNWDKIDTEIGNIRENINGNDTDITDLKSRVTDLETNLETAQNNIDEIKEEQITQNENIKDNTTAIEKNAESIEQNTTDITKLQEDNAKLKAQIPKGQASGEEIDLSDSAEMELVGFNIQGNSYQETTKGWQILKDTNEGAKGWTETNYGGKIDISDYIEDGINGVKFTVTSPITSYRVFLRDANLEKIENNTNYTIQFELKMNKATKFNTSIQTSSALNMLIDFGSINYNEEDVGTWKKFKIKATSNDVAKGQQKLYMTVDPNDNAFKETDDYIEIRNLILVKGDYSKQDLEWEKYTGVKKAPNLNFPQDVEAVGDNINIFDNTVEIVTSTINDNGIEVPDAATNDYYKQIIIPDSKKYIMSYKKNNQGYVRMAYYNGDTFISRQYSNQNGFIFTVPDNCNKIDCRTNAGTNNEIKFTNLKIEKGEVATSYSPYNQGSTEIVHSNKNIFEVTSNLEGVKTSYTSIVKGNFILQPNIYYTVTCDTNNNGGKLYLNEDIFATNNRMNCDGKRHAITAKIKNAYTSNYKGATLLKTEGVVDTAYKISNVQIAINDKIEFIEHEGNTYTIPIQKPFYKLIFDGDFNNPNPVSARDCFIKKNGKWFEQHKIAKVNLENIDWYAGSTQEGSSVNYKRWNSTTRYNNDKCGVTGSSNRLALCNYLINKFYNLYSVDELGFNIENNEICIRFPISVANSATDIKTFWQEKAEEGNGAYILYPAKEAELIECTSEQTEILNQIIKDGTYKGITHFYTTNDLKPEIEITYYKDLETIINKQVEMQATLDNVQAQLLNL